MLDKVFENGYNELVELVRRTNFLLKNLLTRKRRVGGRAR